MFACLHAPGNLPLLVECAGYFSPHIEETSPDTILFDIRGLGSIFGTPEQIASEIHRRLGLPANLAIAANPDAAGHAARGIRGVTVIPPGKEAEVLAPLPLFLLGGSPEFARTLDIWGIRTFGEFAALPPLGIAARLGDEGLAMQRLARGEGRRLLKTYGGPLEFSEEIDLESPIELLEPLLLLLSRMLNDLCRRLGSQSLASNQICLLLKLERARDHSTTLQLPVPMLDPKVFLKLLQLELSGRPPEAAVEKIRLELKPVEPRTTQHGLFIPAAPVPEKLEITLARIRALVGAANAGAPELLDTHRPDSFRMRPLAFAKEGSALPKVASLKLTPPKLALRRFRPRSLAQVWCTQDGQPAKVSSPKGGGKVVACVGPWHSSGDWWTGEAWDRREWDVEIAAGIFRIHLDRRLGCWFMEGSYD